MDATTIYREFLNNPIKRPDDFKKYSTFYKCTGLWNNYATECTFDEFLRVISWMCYGDYYESPDGKSIFVHGYSVADMN